MAQQTPKSSVDPLLISQETTLNDPISAIPYDATSFSPQLSKLIGDLVKSNDPMDQPSFDRITYINTLFPDVLSLMSLDPAVAKLKDKIKKMDEDIVKEVRNQTNVGAQGKKDLEDAKKSVNELFGKVKDIKDKAEKSEQMVMEITRDIKSLDHAKKYLTTSIKYLKQLRMQISDVEHLKVVVSKRRYREIGNLLEIVLERQQGFAAHSNIPKIKSLNTVIEKLRDEMTKIIYEEFARFDAQEQGVPISPHLSDVCFVVDALGYHLKDEFITKFVDGQLQDYRTAFSDDRELESITKRFYWLQCELEYFDKTYSNIFPPSWRMAELISEEFCIATKLTVSALLEATKKTLDVKFLIRAVEKTIEFERGLSDRFRAARRRTGTSNSQYFDEEGEGYPVGNGDDEDGGGGFDPEAIKKRWQVHQHNKEKEEEHRQLQQIQKQQEEALQGGAESGARPPVNFKGIISSAFDPYMDQYINQEDRNIKQMLESLIAEETWIAPEDSRNNVLGSSTDLVYYFNEARKRCAKLTRGQPFFDLTQLFKKYLAAYANILNSRLPPENARNLSEDEAKKMCIILNTAEYCNNTITQMKDTLVKLVDDQFKDKIDLQKEADEFSDTIARGLKVLVNNLEAKLEPAMQNMARIPYGAEDGIVGEESSYVNEIDTILASEIPIYRSLLGTAHFKYFCDLFVGSFLPRLNTSIFKLRRISELGAQRLLLDVTTLRKVFVMMPTFGLTDGTPAPARFIRLVNQEISKIEILLKVLLIPASTPDKLAEMYRNALPEGTTGDFAKVLELKGLQGKAKEDVMLRFINAGTRAPRDALQRLMTLANVF